jgi:hypothetical protein
VGRVGTRALRWGVAPPTTLGRCAANHAGALRRQPRWGVAPPTTLLASLAGVSLRSTGPDPCFKLNYLCDDNESINNLTKRYHRDDKSPAGAKPPPPPSPQKYSRRVTKPRNECTARMKAVKLRVYTLKHQLH